MAEENAVLMYKGRPLMRKDNMIYYGSMADSHIVMLQVLETKKQGDLEIATKVSVQLQLTDTTVRSRDRVVKKSEKDGLYTALDFGSVCVCCKTLFYHSRCGAMNCFKHCIVISDISTSCSSYTALDFGSVWLERALAGK